MDVLRHSRSESNAAVPSRIMKLYYTRRGIPHGYLCATPIHLIYRVDGCAPVGELRRLEEELVAQLKVVKSLESSKPEEIQKVLEDHLLVYDQLLDAQDQSKYILKQSLAAEEVIKSWLTMQEMGLVAVYVICVMGNHVHVLLKGPDGKPDKQMGRVVHQHKTFSSREIKRVCGVTDRVWDDGFYDRYVRAGSFWKVLLYILNNPVSAGIVGRWRDWPHVYIDPRCLVGVEARGW